MVLRRCRRLLRDEDAALDACQDVFVRVLEHRSRLDNRYPSSLLYRMATNVCLNRLRDNRRNPVTPDEAVLYEIARAEEPGATSEARLLLARLGLSGGYNWMTDFPNPVGVRSNYSGAESGISFGFLWGQGR
jgi:RNA polymerase sigma-70 factor (ECF subfamily)